MANIDAPNGFRVVGTLSGAPWTASVRKMFSVNDNLFMGDIVEKDDATSATGKYMCVDRAEADDIPVGVVVGWEPNPDALGRLYHAASTTIGVYVCVDPMVVLEAQVPASGLAVTDIGLNVDFVVAAGSTSTGLSNMEIDDSTEATTADEPLKIICAVDRADNDLSSANARWLVMFNQHAFKTDAGTAGL
jgi:hypothetical protein